MVKIGFICEGATEQILLLSDSFQQYLSSINLIAVNVINASGNGNLLPQNIGGFMERLEKSGAEVAVILTDLDDDKCITRTKERIKPRVGDIVIIAVKKIEAWFLANDKAMRSLLKYGQFSFPNPEETPNPFVTINSLLIEYTGRGIGRTSSAKIKLVSKLIELGFDLQHSANHPNCLSARYFLSKLREIGGR